MIIFPFYKPRPIFFYLKQSTENNILYADPSIYSLQAIYTETQAIVRKILCGFRYRNLKMRDFIIFPETITFNIEL